MDGTICFNASCQSVDSYVLYLQVAKQHVTTQQESNVKKPGTMVPCGCCGSSGRKNDLEQPLLMDQESGEDNDLKQKEEEA